MGTNAQRIRPSNSRVRADSPVGMSCRPTAYRSGARQQILDELRTAADAVAIRLSLSQEHARVAGMFPGLSAEREMQAPPETTILRLERPGVAAPSVAHELFNGLRENLEDIIEP